jgi:hypothetical protein
MQSVEIAVFDRDLLMSSISVSISGTSYGTLVYSSRYLAAKSRAISFTSLKPSTVLPALNLLPRSV